MFSRSTTTVGESRMVVHFILGHNGPKRNMDEGQGGEGAIAAFQPPPKEVFDHGTASSRTRPNRDARAAIDTTCALAGAHLRVRGTRGALAATQCRRVDW